jgi:hypothetical protein
MPAVGVLSKAVNCTVMLPAARMACARLMLSAAGGLITVCWSIAPGEGGRAGCGSGLKRGR